MSSDTMKREFFHIPSSAILLSIILHILAPFLVITVGIMGEKGWLPFLSPPRDLKKEIFQNFIQVDVVALPDELAQDKASVDMGLPIVERPAEQPENISPAKEDVIPALDPSIDKNAELAKRIEMEKQAKEKEAKEKAFREKQRLVEQEKALKRMQEEAAREAALQSLAGRSGKSGRKALSGNILSKGNATKGAIGNAKDQYSAQIFQMVKDHFNIYPWQKKKKLSADVQMELYPNGRLRMRKITKASSDPIYDSSVLQAIDDAQPFPPPEDPSVLDGGIFFTFIPE